MKNKNVLITGSTGYLGSYLATKLVKSDWTVYALIRGSSNLKRVQHIANQLKFIYEVEDIIKMKIDLNLIIHCATSYGRKGETLTQVYESNLMLPLKLLQLTEKIKNCHFINIDTVLSKETNEYALSKKQFIEVIQSYRNKHLMRFINLQLEHFYGPYDDDSKFTTMVIRKCLDNVGSIDLTLGEQKRDFIYIDDLIEAIMKIVNNGLTLQGSPSFEQYIIGSGEKVSIREFVELVHKLTSSTTQLNFGAIPYRKHELMDSHTDIAKIKNIGWSPIFSLHEGINKCINEYGEI